MKIYFEDGGISGGPTPNYNFCLNGLRGARSNYEYAKRIQKDYGDNIAIYTNDIIFLLNAALFAWDGDTFTIYLRDKKGEWVLIQDLTTRELRQGHNIFRLWFAGEFGDGLEETGIYEDIKRT